MVLEILARSKKEPIKFGGLRPFSVVGLGEALVDTGVY